MGNLKKTAGNVIYTKEQIMHFLFVLDSLNMNYSAASRQLNIHRNTLRNHKENYWKEYLLSKKKVVKQSEIIEIRKEIVLKEMSYFKNKLGNVHDLAIERLVDILKDKDKKLSPSVLLKIVKETAPYLIEKEGLNPTGGNTDAASQHTTFVQNIINKMAIYGNQGT